MRMKCFFSTMLIVAAVLWAGPVSYHGQLTVDGNRIKNSDKTRNVQIKGPSLYWSAIAGAPQYSQKTVDWFVDSMDISVVRAAMAIRYWDNNSVKPIYDGAGNFGYLSSEEPTAKAQQLARVEEVIRAAILNDIYVIVDWHSHQAHNETNEATAFFTDLATRYKGVPNLIFEIYNEPTNSVSWNSVYNYAKTVISAIRATGNTNLILVGSPSWSSNPHQGANSDLHTTFSNIAYTMHFYAGTHSTGGTQHSNSNTAMNNGAAVFVSEWGTVNADGGGSPNQSSSAQWTAWMDQNSISSANWSAVNLDEGSAMWASGAANTIANLSASGKIFYNYMGNKTNPPSGYPWGRSLTVSLKEGEARTFSLTDLQASSGAVFTTGESMLADGDGSLHVTGSQLTYTAPAEANSSVISFNYWLNLDGKTSKHRVSVNVNRKPRISVTELSVSKQKESSLTLAKLGITDPENNPLTFVSATVGQGYVAVASDKKSLIYTPPVVTGASLKTSLTYKVTDGYTDVPWTVALTLENIAPILGNKVLTIPNTESAVWNKSSLGIYDADGDTVSLHTARIEAGYPGQISISEDRNQLTYIPEAGKISGERVPVYLTATDGALVSAEGRLLLRITGVGAEIVQDLSSSVLPFDDAKKWGIRLVGNDNVALRLLSGDARLDAFSLQGRHLGTLWRGGGSGMHMLSLRDMPVTSGLYVLRLQQGSQIQVLQVLKH